MSKITIAVAATNATLLLGIIFWEPSTVWFLVVGGCFWLAWRLLLAGLGAVLADLGALLRGE